MYKVLIQIRLKFKYWNSRKEDIIFNLRNTDEFLHKNKSLIFIYVQVSTSQSYKSHEVKKFSGLPYFICYNRDRGAGVGESPIQNNPEI